MFFPKSEYLGRVDKVREAIEKNRLDAFLATGKENVRYLSGVNSGRVLITQKDAIHWLTPVYSDLTAGVLEERERTKDSIEKFILKKGFKRVGVDDLSYLAYRSINPRLRKLLRPTTFIEDLRKLKSRREIEAIEKAAEIAKRGMRVATGQDIEGKTEQQLIAEIEYEIRKLGSEVPPFGSGAIVLSGPNARHPHAFPSNRVIRRGDQVVVDIGAVFEGYHSDMTRTIRIGELESKRAKLCDFIDDLKEAGIAMVETGKQISIVHKYIEKQIESRGYKFIHSSGHGVGLQIHEKPNINGDEKGVFEAGMVVTIEPGIYTNKLGGFGCRSEDTVVVGDTIRVLTV